MKVVFWSQTGNTQAMAEAIAEGIQAAGKEAEVLEMDGMSAADLNGEAVFALGCPAMGDEVLEEDVVEPFVAELEGSVSGKKVALFGSYGWGDGQWMRDWTERMKNAGAVIIGGEGLIVNETPEDDGLEACRALGKAMAGEIA
ncbi:MAG: flavodoxin [Lachnospiraceae bacterium]|nr:flavodoxin [Lachnospiraceae bacterium]